MKPEVDVEGVAAWLGWPSGTMEDLTELAVVVPVPGAFAFPAEPKLREELAALDVPPHAIDEIIAGLPSPATTPYAWWLLERLHHKLTDMQGVAFLPPWPTPIAGEDPLTRYFHVYVFVAALPHIRRLHADRGISPEVTRATLADLGLQVAHYQRWKGFAGFDGAFWLWQHFRALMFRLGRLQFTDERIDFDPAPGAGFARGDPSLGIHIPAAGPLTPGGADDALAQARTFFRKHFPERVYRIGTCSSWMLDPQLAVYLPAKSNIVMFQQRFTLVEDWVRPGDEDLMRFVFGIVPERIADLPQTTTLERAVVRHLRDGNHWNIRLGWLDV